MPMLFIALLIIMNSCCQFCLGDNVKLKNEPITLEKAIKIGKQKLVSINKEWWDRKLTINADNNNSSWKRHTEIYPSVLNDGLIVNMEINKQEYWAIYYKPTYEEDEDEKLPVMDEELLKEGWTYEPVVFPISAYVFIEKGTGLVLGVLLYK